MDIGLALRVARDNWDDLTWWKESAIPFARRTALAGVLKPYYRYFGPDGEDFMEEDWDTLLILDACRYDMFESTCTIDGDLTQKNSLGSATPEFLQRTFRNGDFPDTVYVTSNPQVNLRLDTDIFHDVVNVWKSDWHDELGTVEPQFVTKRAFEVQERYPNKRIIVHYMQPHYPFIGEKHSEDLGDHSGFELSKRLASDEDVSREGLTVWDRLKNGELPEDAVWDAYIENLELVLSDIGSNISKFEGKTVITSDHGNMLGEVATPLNIELYGHPTGIHAEDLIAVPWLEIESDSRKHISAETASEDETTASEEDSDVIEERLKDLGYV
ncbi:hypothetical protein [Salinarchaeum laminariae]|uniref:hypothetical protein n=1 Tax=Salinarchaeum laminariae TaxID=869888 RepID=UPI0020C142EC|nr:hypothetical protein [Salinarchaeum laminariae]